MPQEVDLRLPFEGVLVEGGERVVVGQQQTLQAAGDGRACWTKHMGANIIVHCPRDPIKCLHPSETWLLSLRDGSYGRSQGA